MIRSRERFGVISHFGFAVSSIGCFYLIVMAAFGSLTRSGWGGAQSYIHQTKTILSFYLVWLIVYYFIRRWIGIRLAILFITIPLSLFFFLPSFYASNYTSEIAVLIFVCMIGFGSALDQLFCRNDKIGFVSWPIFGNIFTVVVLHILDILKILNIFTVTIMILSGIVFFMKEIKSILNKNYHKNWNLNYKVDKALLDALVILIFPISILAFASNGPDMLFDSLAMKAWLPNQWYLQNSMFLLTDHLQSGILGSAAYFLFQGNYIGASNIGGQFQFLSLLYIVLMTVILGLKNRKGVLAVFFSFLFATIPAILWQVSGAYDDLWLTLLATSGVLTIIFLSKTSIKSGKAFPTVLGVVAASLFLGKLSLLPYMGVVLISPLFFPSLPGLKLKSAILLKTFTLFIVGISIPVLWRWINYGNPVWPLYNGIFRAESLPPTNEHFNLPMGPISLNDLLLAPISSFFNPGKWVEAGSIGAYSFTLASAYLGVTFLLRKKFDYAVFLVGFLSLIFLINWWVSFRYLRYTFTIAPLVFITLLISNIQIYKYLRDSVLVLLLLLISIPALVAIPTGNPASPDRIPFNTIMGFETPEQYRLRGMPAVVVINWLNSNASPNANIAGSGSVFYQRLLLRGDLDIYYDWELNPKNSKDIDYVLIYRQISSSILVNLSSDKCLLRSFNDEFDLYGECR